ncbi:MAG: hypothetical protein LBF68_03420 [Christensenellaceae bacterium]|jgi:ribonuclease-3|nr:hypothetical protein [Christensenellaceae bacterium]
MSKHAKNIPVPKFTDSQILKLENIIQYKFQDLAHLEEALTHASLTNNASISSYERFEFFGDSILGFIVAGELFHAFPDANVGDLTRAKSYIVSKNTLAQIVEKMGITRFLFTNKDVNQVIKISKKVRSDIFESLLCAIYIDSKDLSNCTNFVNRFLGHFLKMNISDISNLDYKSILYEYNIKLTLNLKVEFLHDLNQTGHEYTAKIFKSDDLIAEAKASTKIDAEKNASKIALKILNLLPK